MTAHRIRIAARTFRTRMTALAAVGAAVLGLGLVATSAAQAQPKGGPGGGSGAGATCPIEIDGKMTTVPEGTRVGIFVCGHDGIWHLGWLINDIASPKAPGAPVITVANATQVRLARAAG